MIKNYFNDDKLFESVYKMNECGGFVGRCGASYSSSSTSTDSCGHSRTRARSFKVGDEVTIVTSDGEFVDGELVGPAN